jgi:hypothetical protein
MERMKVSAEIVKYAGGVPGTPTANVLVALCDRYRLDPLLKQVEIIKTGGGSSVYITAAGYVDIAHRSGQLDGIVTDWTAESENGNWSAQVSVYRKDMGHPFTGKGGCGKNEKKDDPEQMATTRAVRRALRIAFPVIREVEVEYGLEDPVDDESAGLPAPAEMAPGPTAPTLGPAPIPARGTMTRDDIERLRAEALETGRP